MTSKSYNGNMKDLKDNTSTAHAKILPTIRTVVHSDQYQGKGILHTNAVAKSHRGNPCKPAIASDPNRVLNPLRITSRAHQGRSSIESFHLGPTLWVQTKVVHSMQDMIAPSIGITRTQSNVRPILSISTSNHAPNTVV